MDFLAIEQSVESLRRVSCDSMDSTGGGATSEASSPISARSSVSSIARGPWDHSASIKVPFDVEAVLAPPQRAVVNVMFVR